MNLLAPIPLSTILILGATLGALTVVAYILKMRRRRFEVPFSTLWHRVLKESESTALWKQLRRWLSLLLSLSILGLLILAATDPVIGDDLEGTESVVIIVDASASMLALSADRTQTRIDVARDRARALVRSLGSDDRAMIVRMGAQATPLSRFSTDVPALLTAIDSLVPEHAPADLRGALAAAADALRDRPSPRVVIISDGARFEDPGASIVFETPAQPRLDTVDLSGIDVSFVPVPGDGENVGIVAFNVRRYRANKSAYEVFLELQNFGEKPVTRRLTILSGEDPLDSQEVTLPPGKKIRRIYNNVSGGDSTILRAALEGGEPDTFPLDDTADAMLPEQRKQRVLLVSDDNLYIEAALLAYENVIVDKFTAVEYRQEIAAQRVGEYDALIFHRMTPDVLPPGRPHTLYFGPSGPSSPFPIAKTLTAPRITSKQSKHPAMKWSVWSDVNFDRVSVFQVRPEAKEVALARSIRAPIIAAKRDGARKIVATGFGIDATDAMLRPALPLFLVAVLEWFAGTDTDLLTTYASGEVISILVDTTLELTGAQVRSPSGTVTPLPIQRDGVSFFASETGLHELTLFRGEEAVHKRRVAVNLSNPQESDIRPSETLSLGGRELAPATADGTGPGKSLWGYLILLVLILLCVEWVTYQRRLTL